MEFCVKLQIAEMVAKIQYFLYGTGISAEKFCR